MMSCDPLRELRHGQTKLGHFLPSLLPYFGCAQLSHMSTVLPHAHAMVQI